MRIHLAIVPFLLLLVSVAEGQAYKTKETFACTLKSDMQKFDAMRAEGDRAAGAKMLDEKRCFLMKEGVKVFRVGDSWGLVEIRPEGVTDSVWTNREAIEEVKPQD
jgi:hypothetical protein